MLPKLLTIVWKDVYSTFTNRTLLLIMLAAPLALSAIISLAFSGFISGDPAPLRDIPVAVVNLDAGTEAGGQTINYGTTLTELLVPPGDASEDELAANTLYTLLDATLLGDAEAARAAVDEGTYTAAIIVPAGFSASLNTIETPPGSLAQAGEAAGDSSEGAAEAAAIEVYSSPASPIAASIVDTVSRGIVGQFTAGSIAIDSTIDALVQRAQSQPLFGLAFLADSNNGTFQPDFSSAFDSDVQPLTVQTQTLEREESAFNPLVLFGTGQAVFFMMFTALGSISSLYEEQRTGTLARMMTTPTPHTLVLLGKLIGTLVICVFQVAILIVALTVMGSVLAGEFQFIFGRNIPLIALTIFAVALAASGLASIVMSLARNEERGNIIGSLLILASGVAGGVFFSVQGIPVLNELSRLTIIFWGTDAFQKLALGQSEIGLNLFVLLVLGAVFFGIGAFFFNRRLQAA